MPFTFVFNGTFFDLEHVFTQLNGFALRNAANALQVRGRLLTVQSVKLSQVPQTTNEGQKTGATELTGTITATAYVLPASQGLTGPSPPLAARPLPPPAAGPRARPRRRR